MQKRILKNMKKYMYTSTCPVNYSKDYLEQCEFLGYIDGYFAEQMYIVYIENTINNQDKIENYFKGYQIGKRNRQKVKAENPKQLIEEKNDWLKELALNDTLNNVSDRILSDNAFEYYNFYKNNINIDLGSMKITPLNHKK